MRELEFYAAVYFASSWATLIWVLIFTIKGKIPSGGSVTAMIFSAFVGMVVTLAVFVADQLV